MRGAPSQRASSRQTPDAVYLLSALALAFRPLVHRPMRTLLLLQGTIWGVAVALFPSAVIAGTRHATLTRGAVLGADRIAVATDPTAPAGGELLRGDALRLRDALQQAGIPVIAAGGSVWCGCSAPPAARRVRSSRPIRRLRAPVA